MVFGAKCIFEVYVCEIYVLVGVFSVFKSGNVSMDLRGCISQWVKTFLNVVEDFMMFAKGGEQRCEGICEEFVYGTR